MGMIDRPSRGKLANLHNIMADIPKKKKTTILIPLDKWKEIKAYSADQEMTIAQLFLDGYELLRKTVDTAKSKDGKPLGGDAS